MIQGVININGYIGSFPDENGVEMVGVELIDVISQVQSQPQAESFLVKINSKGGVCSTGYDIYNYLKTLGKPIHTEATGSCCSMATIIMMAGETRVAIEPLDFLPHNPWTDGVKGDADQILMVAEEMRQQEDKMINFYSDATGISKDGIDAIMKLDKAIPLEKAVELKFLTAIKKSLKPLAVIKAKNDMTLIKDLGKKLDSIMNMVKGLSPIKALTLTTSDGSQTIEISKADGSEVVGDPMPGDLVMVAGAPAPDGVYVFDGYSLEVLMGVITLVTPTEVATEAARLALEAEEKAKEEAATKALADSALLAENEALKKENQELKADTEALAVKFDSMEKALSVIKSNYVAPEGVTAFARTKETLEDLKTQAAKRKELYKK